MSALIDPYDDPIERCNVLCSEVSFELKQDLFAIEYEKSNFEEFSTDATVRSTSSNTPKICEGINILTSAVFSGGACHEWC
jgi:hypothetical protein